MLRPDAEGKEKPVGQNMRIVSATLMGALLASAVPAREPDAAREATRAQDRLDREMQRAAERSAQLGRAQISQNLQCIR